MYQGDVKSLTETIRLGDLSASAAVTQALARLDEVSDLGPTAWRDDDFVLQCAQDADGALAEGRTLGALHGVPITVKDWIDVRGFPCVGEGPARTERRPETDATVVARLRAAGAIVVAKSNVSDSHGTARNPWDPSRTPGHSSSGDAIAVAAGAVPLGIGSDSGGSLRFPAHCCGIATIKPTFGRVPATGHFPKIGLLTDGRTVIGPLGRSIADVRLALDVISGADQMDPDNPPVELEPYDLQRPLRVVFHRDVSVLPTTDVTAMMQRIGNELSDAGHQLTESDVLRPEQALDITQRYWDRPLPTGQETEAFLADWQAFKRHGMQVMGSTDVIVSPAAPHPAPPIGDTTDTDWTYTLGPSLWGFPAAVVPGGIASDGLPLGVQVVAPAWEDNMALTVAERLEVTLDHATGNENDRT